MSRISQNSDSIDGIWYDIDIPRLEILKDLDSTIAM